MNRIYKTKAKERGRDVNNYAEKNEQDLRNKYGNNYIAVLNNKVLAYGGEGLLLIVRGGVF